MNESNPESLYEHRYPSAALASEHPFIEYKFVNRSPAEMAERGAAFRELMEARRSIRLFSDKPVARELIEQAIITASTAPSGAHKQPWTFAVTGDSTIKSAIREAAEEEERTNYLENRMNDEWQEAIAPIGTDHHKEFLEVAPWIVVLFEQRYELRENGQQAKNYYVKESCGMAAGLFVAALHNMGLATLTHTPSPMNFLKGIFERPDNERPFVMFPVGYPLPGVQVPDLKRKSLGQVMVEAGPKL